MGGVVVVLGDVNVDVLVSVRDPLALASDTPARVAFRPGGSAANTAAWLGAQGGRVAFVGRVGDDAAGREAAAALAACGVDVRVAVGAGASTGACVVLVDGAGERTMLPDPGANAGLTADDLPGDLFVAEGWLHVSGYALLSGGANRAAAAEALRRARAAGMGTSVDAASAAPLARMGGADFLGLCGEVDVLMATVDEAEVLAGTRDAGVAAERLLARVPEVVLKLGGDGAAWWSRDGGQVAVPAVAPAGPVVDTTGAGDAFAAGWLAARTAGATPDAALRRACTLAALAVTTEGARPG